MIVYLDTSAVLRILIDEPGMHDMREAFNGWQLTGDDLVSSFLLHTEMHCAARRRSVAAPEEIDMLLGGIGLIDIDRALLLAAAKEPRGLRSADAIHLATALAVEADVLVTYDQELAEAAAKEGVGTAGPGICEPVGRSESGQSAIRPRPECSEPGPPARPPGQKG